MQSHPFADYVRILARGRKGSRSLTQIEAEHAMRLILDAQVEPEQLGAFLMLLRVKEESIEEMAGFTQAARQSIQAPPLQVQLDWSSYAGKSRQLPWFILSALLLAQTGIRIFMHGHSGHSSGRLYTEPCLQALGLPVCTDWAQVEQQLNLRQFAYLPLRQFSPVLAKLIELRSLLGVRSSVHSFSRMLNPLQAPFSFHAIFHPPYQAVHQQAGLLLGDQNMLIIKGDSGEAERSPDRKGILMGSRHGDAFCEDWTALTGDRQIVDPDLRVERLLACWRGETHEPYGELAIQGTCAVVLKHLGRADTATDAEALARQLWQQRRIDWL